MNSYIRPLLRFWWVLAIGLCAALVADAQLVVDSAQGWLFRTNVRVSTPQPNKTARECPRDPKTGAQKCQTVDIPQPAQVQDQTPNMNLLVQRANFYPSLIESTPFLDYRDKLYPGLPKKATLTSTALGEMSDSPGFI